MATPWVINELLNRLYVLGKSDMRYLHNLLKVADLLGLPVTHQIKNNPFTLPAPRELPATCESLQEEGVPIDRILPWRDSYTPAELWEVYAHEDATEYEIFALLSIGLDGEDEAIWSQTEDCLKEAMGRCRPAVMRRALIRAIQDGNNLNFRRLDKALPAFRNLLFTERLAWSLRETERMGTVFSLEDLFDQSIERMSKVPSGANYEFHRARLLRILEATPQEMVRRFWHYGVLLKDRGHWLKDIHPDDARLILDRFGLLEA